MVRVPAVMKAGFERRPAARKVGVPAELSGRRAPVVVAEGKLEGEPLGREDEGLGGGEGKGPVHIAGMAKGKSQRVRPLRGHRPGSLPADAMECVRRGERMGGQGPGLALEAQRAVLKPAWVR